MARTWGEIKVTVDQRICEVHGEYGYFHLWETTPDCTYGLVEFDDGTIRRVGPTNIRFCDENNRALRYMNEAKRKQLAEAVEENKQGRNS